MPIILPHHRHSQKQKKTPPPFEISPKLLMFKRFQKGIHCTRQQATKEATEAWLSMVWRSIWKVGACHPTQISRLAGSCPFPSRGNPGSGGWYQQVLAGLLRFTLWLPSYFPAVTLIGIR